MHITKKEFKEGCSFQVFTGRGTRVNAIYFDWVSNEFGRGFKYGAAMEIENGTKAELFDEFYDWIVNGKYMSHWVYSKFAQYDSQRFKLDMTFNYTRWN